MNNELTDNIEKLHTTELGVIRIKKNMGINSDDVVKWCKEKVLNAHDIFRKGKNWYVYFDSGVITVNAHSYTVITAHKNKK